MPEEFRFADLHRLLQSGVLGGYRSLEVTSIVQAQKADGKIFNLLTLLVGQNCAGRHAREVSFLGSRIHLPGLSDLSFSITRHEISLDELETELRSATVAWQWVNGGKTLRFGNLQFRGRWFAPADGAGDKVPLNQVLKNNFWNGSHVYEWTDVDKSPFRPLLEQPTRLQQLSEKIAAFLPIHLAGLSDRLGGLIVQLPVQALQADYQGRPNRGGAEVELHWRPGVAARALTISVSREYDGLFSEVIHPPTQAAKVELELPDSPGLQFATIKDADSGELLGRHPLSFLRSGNFHLGVGHAEKRVFTLPSASGPVQQEVNVTTTQSSQFGDPHSLSHLAETSNRIYRAEMAQLQARLELVQYKPDKRSKEDRHVEALGHLRQLISRYGRHAVCLWDPFLDANDVLQTLFFNPHAESRMRAISGADTVGDVAPPSCVVGGSTGGAAANPPLSKAQQFVESERRLLQRHASNAKDLQLEFRARSDAAGWAFHDRFIIFPQAEGPALAWSLGTSVNSCGEQHHLLQKVPDGRLIADAFDSLWNTLDQPGHQIWKTP